jgi:hypothetical protein
VLNFYTTLAGGSHSWTNINMVRVLTRLGIREMSLSTLLKSTLEEK